MAEELLGADPPQALPAPAAPAAPREPWQKRQARALKEYFSEQDPTLKNSLPAAIVISALLYVRSPLSNYIFDEQEALLANPYVNDSSFRFLDAFKRDFWGLPADRSIGSYRPLPNLIWKLLFHVSSRPFLHHLVNLFGHALNAALVASLVFAATRQRRLGWLSGGTFLCFAVLTEAVTGVVGIADVLGGLGVILALLALRLRWLLPLGVFAGLTCGLFSKESAIIGVPLLAWAGLVLAPGFHRQRPLRLYAAFGAGVASIAALVFYTMIRRHFFPVTLPEELAQPLPHAAPLLKRGFHEFLRWFQQPVLPRDPINNPLVDADLPLRVAGALRVYFRGLLQILFPIALSGDYSFPQEPIPARVVFPESVLGAVTMVLPPLFAIGTWIAAMLRERRERRAGTFVTMPSEAHARLVLLALGCMWIPIAYFPHSNIPILLPTVRAERFWYLPCVGAALLMAVALQSLLTSERRKWGKYVVFGWFGVQALMARWHALDYTDDLIFWRATKRNAPNSAKAHLNYSVMVGARGELQERLLANQRALELAPKWPMAHVYLADTLCRMHRAEQAFPHYLRGFELAPNDPNLIALGLQCLWDEKTFEPHATELSALGDEHPGSWLSFLVNDTVQFGKDNGGVQKKYRPRGYDEGPKKE